VSLRRMYDFQRDALFSALSLVSIDHAGLALRRSNTLALRIVFSSWIAG